MNVFLITLDDVNFYNLGFSKYFDHVFSPTPNIDYLSRESYVFYNAHCNIPFCQPSRMGLLTGLYPQNNGSTIFCAIKKNILTLPLILKKSGFFTKIIGKLCHHKPIENFCWDEMEKFIFNNQKNKFEINIANSFSSKDKDNNFFLVNIQNTHRPFQSRFKGLYEGRIPSCLFDTKIIRRDIYCFFKSLKEVDDIVGDIISFSKKEDIIIITSDHGFSFPYFKGNCYGSSTNIPLIIKGENIVNKHDNLNLVSHVDFMPTILDLLKIDLNLTFDGKSYLKTIQGKFQRGFDIVYSQLNQMVCKRNSRIRAVTNKNYTYCINLDPFDLECVDGWGWQLILKEMKTKNKFNKCKYRQYEELVEYSGMDFTNSFSEKNELKLKLFEFMKKYKDPELKKIFGKKIKFE